MPSFELASLGSGSRGNATLIKQEDTRLLVDCGFTIKDTKRRLQRLQTDPSELTAILVTHEHSDHIKGVGALARKYAVPVYSSFGTRLAVAGKRTALDGVDWHELRGGQRVTIGSIGVLPVTVPHDAREPCQFVFEYQNHRCGILTDLGSITTHLVAAYKECDALLLESNHDVKMLADGPYPPSLKRRVGGQYGHLNNQQSANLLQQLNVSRLQHLVLAHLSEKNNQPQLATEAMAEIIDDRRLIVADQEMGSGEAWLEVA